MPTALILYGPKAVGKSWIARVLAEHLHVYHVDPDELIPRLLAAGKQPDPHDGWLPRSRRMSTTHLRTTSW